jgi:hypothetical protein
VVHHTVLACSTTGLTTAKSTTQRTAVAMRRLQIQMGQYPMQVQWLARTLRYWNKLADLVQQGPSLLGSTFLTNVTVGE